ncbi:MAG: hypothetical protein HY702_00195 [Gemmatimonadetes bacterium]|nr:hypothetical protein [Gemmatimonadota bacterium]
MRKRASAWTLILICVPSVAAGQEPRLARACEPFIPGDVRNRCLDVAATVELLQPEAGMLLAGANPVLGTASPLGTRAGLPRFSLGARVGVVFVDLPDVFEVAGPGVPEEMEFVVPLPQADLAVGLFSGFSLTPSVGGLGALDFLASATVLPAVEQLEETKIAWGFGGRVGIFRESFVLPGASVSVMHKRLGRLAVGDIADGDEAEFGTDLRVLSLRGAVSKSFLIFGLTVGAGWDRYRSDIDFRFVSPVPPNEVQTVFSQDAPGELETDRRSLFGEFRLTFAVLSLVAQAGLQQREELVLSDGTTRMESGGFFAGAGLRVGI